MCLILLSWNAHPRYRLVVAANRDEFHARPATPVEYWREHRQILAGRDLQAGGTWLGVTTTGRFSAITNFRDPGAPSPAGKSRGELTRAFLAEQVEPRVYLDELRDEAADYGPFNLFVSDLSMLASFSSRNLEMRVLDPGLYGLSNHTLDTPWPKVVKGKGELRLILEQERRGMVEEIFRMLGDRTPAADSFLPDTGVGLERERDLSPIFIVGGEYGTRSSTVVLVNEGGTIEFFERVFSADGSESGRRAFVFHL